MKFFTALAPRPALSRRAKIIFLFYTNQMPDTAPPPPMCIVGDLAGVGSVAVAVFVSDT